MKKLAIAALLSLSAAGAHAAVTNLLVNGSFEATAQGNGSWNIYNNLPGWTGAPNIELRNNVAGSAAEGKNYVELDTTGNSSMYQDVATQAGKHYQLTFFWSARPGTGDTNDINVFWNGQQVSHLAGSNPTGAHQWQQFSFDVVGGSNALSRLTFAAAGRSDSLGGSLDNVSLTSAVPEPGEYAMLLGGLAMLGLMARRRKA